MASPFPGMDPYLEHPAIFPGLHDRMIAYLSESLQAKLPEPYFAEISDRLWGEFADRPVTPDVDVLSRREEPSDVPPRAEAHEAATAVAVETSAEAVVVSVSPDEIGDELRDPYLEIRTIEDRTERLVTTVEVLSPSNKRAKSLGRQLYLRKQAEILGSEVHLVEIDLLRGGMPTTAVPPERLAERTGKFDYHVCIHRGDRFTDFFVYPWRLRERMPRFALPLDPDVAPVVVDLQGVFERAYDTGPYRRRIRYCAAEIVPALTEDDAKWAEARLEKNG